MTELRITRVFDAPRALVYRAFTDPDQLAAWFGPVGWSVPRETVEIDARPGGVERFTMVNDDDPSLTSPTNAVFVEVIENELLVGEEEFAGVVLRVRLEFHDEPDGRTRLELVQGPIPAEIEGNAREGWASSFTKLDALLAGA
ncbi:SRPBCC family protein [Actinoplanes solisilvae]|uniref:SRPBCC family protein n=1 Tax=Actinoplanes solisilvae TaxID=2486853 RepID=UPI000FDB58F9|nr:SRPBCC domain-containing protein [Actinoplanes solisilvae]